MASLYNQGARVVRILLDLPGIDVNAVDSEGQTALYYATSYNCKELVAVLLDQAAVDLNAVVDRWGHTALQIAAAHNNGDVVKFLLDTSGTDLNATCNERLTALLDAVSHNMKILLHFC